MCRQQLLQGAAWLWTAADRGVSPGQPRRGLPQAGSSQAGRMQRWAGIWLWSWLRSDRTRHGLTVSGRDHQSQGRIGVRIQGILASDPSADFYCQTNLTLHSSLVVKKAIANPFLSLVSEKPLSQLSSFVSRGMPMTFTLSGGFRAQPI